jgi:hypothetical protein
MTVPKVLVDPDTRDRYTVIKMLAREKHPGHFVVAREDLRTAEEIFAARDENWNFCGSARPQPTREK